MLKFSETKKNNKIQFAGKEEAANVDNFRKFQEDFWKKDFVNKGRQKLNFTFQNWECDLMVDKIVNKL